MYSLNMIGPKVRDFSPTMANHRSTSQTSTKLFQLAQYTCKCGIGLDTGPQNISETLTCCKAHVLIPPTI